LIAAAIKKAKAAKAKAHAAKPAPTVIIAPIEALP
jgi:hypothetical protein